MGVLRRAVVALAALGASALVAPARRQHPGLKPVEMLAEALANEVA